MRSEPVTGNLTVGRPFTHATNTCCRSARRNPGHRLRDKRARPAVTSDEHQTPPPHAPRHAEFHPMGGIRLKAFLDQLKTDSMGFQFIGLVSRSES